MREYQVRICERLGVKFPGPTRQHVAYSLFLAQTFEPLDDLVEIEIAFHKRERDQHQINLIVPGPAFGCCLSRGLLAPSADNDPQNWGACENVSVEFDGASSPRARRPRCD